MLTVVVGKTGTEFRAPEDALNLDKNFDFDNLKVVHVAFSAHRLMLRATEDYVIERLAENLETTVFVWNDEVHILEHILPFANVVYQHDTCSKKSCLGDAADSFMMRNGFWIPLCERCYTAKTRFYAFREGVSKQRLKLLS